MRMAPVSSGEALLSAAGSARVVRTRWSVRAAGKHDAAAKRGFVLVLLRGKGTSRPPNDVNAVSVR